MFCVLHEVGSENLMGLPGGKVRFGSRNNTDPPTVCPSERPTNLLEKHSYQAIISACLKTLARNVKVK